VTEITNYPVYQELVERPAFCARCAEPVAAIMVPVAYRKLKCPECGLLHYSTPGIVGRARVCKQCLRLFDESWPRLELDDWEAMPAPNLCQKCKDEIDKFNAEIAKGGVSWFCADCGSSGAFDAGSPIAIKLREQEHITPPSALGVQLQGGCPACTGEDRLPDFSGLGISDDDEQTKTTER
jgi:hypothetical protein